MPSTTPRRDDPPGASVTHLDPPVDVLVTVDGKQWPGSVDGWRGQWVHATWTIRQSASFGWPGIWPDAVVDAARRRDP